MSLFLVLCYSVLQRVFRATKRPSKASEMMLRVVQTDHSSLANEILLSLRAMRPCTFVLSCSSCQSKLFIICLLRGFLAEGPNAVSRISNVPKRLTKNKTCERTTHYDSPSLLLLFPVPPLPDCYWIATSLQSLFSGQGSSLAAVRTQPLNSGCCDCAKVQCMMKQGSRFSLQ